MLRLLFLLFIYIVYYSIFFFFFFFLCRCFAKAVGCEMASLKACAKKKSVQELLVAQLKVFASPNFLPFAPVVDGYFMPGMCYFTINVVLRNGFLEIMPNYGTFGLCIASFDSPSSKRCWIITRLVRMIPSLK